MRFLNAGETALVIEFGNEISEALNQQLTFVANALDEAKLPGLVDMIPSYRSLLVNFDPLALSAEALRAAAEQADTAFSQSSAQERKVVTVKIPVLYGGEYGPDLGYIATHTGLSEGEVIRRHSSVEYRIYMIGFTPGFPYLGGLPKELATPRLATPRQAIPAGSVGIAGEQTGVYPMESPGGWQLLGRTPLKLFDPTRKEPFLLKAGQYLRFVPIPEEEFENIAKGGWYA